MRRRAFALQGVLVPTLLAAARGISHASSAGMPWESPLNQLVQSLTGPVAKAVGVFAIVAVGFGMAFSEGGSGMRKALWVVLGLAIAFSAASWGLSFMGFSGGLAV